MAISYTPSSIKGGSWTMYNGGSGGTCYNNFPRLYITGVTLNTATRKITISYKLYQCTTLWSSSKGHNEGYNLAALEAKINGTQVAWFQGSPWYQDGDTWASYTRLEKYHDPEDSSDPTNKPAERSLFKSDSITIDWNGQATQNVSLSVRSLQEWGWSSTRWDTDSLCSRNSTTMTISGLIVPPTITSATVVSNSVGTAAYSGQATKGTGGLEPEYYVWSGLGNSTAGGLAGTVGNLTHNGTYNWTLTVTADDGGQDTASGTVYIKHNAPALSNYSYSGVRSGNYYIGTITYQVGYDNVGYYSHSLSYGTTTSYGSSGVSKGTGSQASWTLNNLLPNTTYHYRVTETDNGHISESTTSGDLTFTTSGNAPIINSVNTSCDQTTCTFSFPNGGITWDNTTAASGNYISVQVKKTSASGWNTAVSGRDTITVTGLTSYTDYDYRIRVTDKQGRTSNYYPGVFKTLRIYPVYVSLDATSVDNNSATMRAEFTCDPQAIMNAEISVGGTVYDTVSNVSSPFIYRVSNLTPDTNYFIYVTLYETYDGSTPAGTLQKHVYIATTMPAPTLDANDIIVVDPFTVQAIIQASIVPSRTIQYRFSKDGGITWTNYQSASIYTWTNLEPETEYNIVMEAKAVHSASGGQDSYLQVSGTVITPADQASIAIKKDGVWQYGKAWFKNNNEWVKAKKVYIKKNGSWIENKNFR